MSEFYESENERRIFPEDDLVEIFRNCDADALDLGFQFINETKESGYGLESNFFGLDEKLDQHFISEPMKMFEDETHNLNFYITNAATTKQHFPEPEQNFQILSKLKTNSVNSNSQQNYAFNQILTKYQTSANLTSPSLITNFESAQPTILNNNITTNYFVNSGCSSLAEDLRSSEKKLNNIFKIKKMIAEQQIEEIQRRVVRKSSEDETKSDSATVNLKKAPIFKTEKIYKNKSARCESMSSDSAKSSIGTSEQKSPSKGPKDFERSIKLIRNRLSAQKSRIKKKIYMRKLEDELLKTKETLNYYKTMSESKKLVSGSLESKIAELQAKENQFNALNTCSVTYTSLEQMFKVKNEYSKLQDNIILDLYKTMVKSITPYELKFLEKSIINVDVITNLPNLDVFIENLIKNQIEFNELYSFELLGNNTNTFSLPFKINMYLENLKKFSIYFREFLYQVKNLPCSMG